MKKLKLGDSERDLLLYVARTPHLTVREISDHFAATRGWGRTTILKTLDRLMEKGYVCRDDAAGAFRYQSTMTEDELNQRMVEQFFANSLGGSLQPLVAYLDGGITVSDEDLARLKHLVEKLEEGRS